MVRKGKHSDIPRIIEMSLKFWDSTNCDEPAEPEAVGMMAEACMGQELMSVLEVRDEVVGFACGVSGPLLANHSVKTGTEIAWWVDPEYRAGRHGILLLRHIEGLAKEAGIKYWNMAYMESSMPEEIKSMYERLGYERTEVIYTRVL